jgi:hypothetical protein
MDATRPLPERGSTPAVAWSENWTLALFVTTVFLGAGLVFAVQPMVAKMLLPSFGGASSVWAVSLVFFQATLLAGYAFAHVSLRLLGARRQTAVQIGLLLVPLAALPIAVGSGASTVDDPNLRLILALTIGTSLPFFAVTTASPVLQRWFSATGHSSGGDPYFLYAAGNAGSLLGLLLYPLLIERALPLDEQARAWAIAYTLFVLLAGACAWRVLSSRGSTDQSVRAAPVSVPLTWPRRLRWVLLAAIPSSLMVGTTTHLSTDVAAVPLLWVIPLALYLLTFVLAFARRERLSLRTVSRCSVVTSLVAIFSLLPIVTLPIWALVSIHGLNLFFLALLIHRRLAVDRPPADRLTEFYLLLSVGGVCGGAFNALLAPIIFPTVAEYPIAIVAALFLRPRPARVRGSSQRLRRSLDILLVLVLVWVILGAATQFERSELFARLFLFAMVGVVALFARRPTPFALGCAALLALTVVPHPALHGDRTFYGVLRVEQDGTFHKLIHGTTVHGVEDFARQRLGEPLSYHSRRGPLGQMFARMGSRFDDVAVIGLGAGAAAAYGAEGDAFTFFEIDPEMARVASDPKLFSYMTNSAADTRVVIGDGRLKLAVEPDTSYDAIVMDAFSSDSVPMHLLTVEAFELYLEKLRPDGVIAFNISNRYLDLEPVVAGIARRLELSGVSQHHPFPKKDYERTGIASSRWVVVARDAGTIDPLRGDKRWKLLSTTPELPVWTDQSSNILDVTHWFRP